MKRILISLVGLVFTACGVGGQPLSSTRTVTTSQALTGAAEWLEFETPQARTELFREVVRQSQVEAGRGGTVMFPMSSDSSGELVAAPALDSKIDLLAAADAGGLMLTFDTRGDRFGEDRRDAFQGLSEREATELIARSVLAQWNVKANGPVMVSRAAGAPYAAAWLDGTLRINPAFVYMASALAPSPAP